MKRAEFFSGMALAGMIINFRDVIPFNSSDVGDKLLDNLVGTSNLFGDRLVGEIQSYKGEEDRDYSEIAVDEAWERNGDRLK